MKNIIPKQFWKNVNMKEKVNIINDDLNLSSSDSKSDESDNKSDNESNNESSD